MKKLRYMPAVLICVFILGLIVRNIRAIGAPFRDWDSGIYAQVAAEIIKNKSLATTFNGEVWLNKPPFVHSLIAFVFLMFGRSEFWARIIMTAMASILLIFTYQLSQIIIRNYYGESKKKISQQSSRMAGMLALCLLVGTPLFIERSSTLNSDIFLAVAWVGYALYRNNKWGRFAFTVLGVWSKSFLGFYPLLLECVIVKKPKITKSIVMWSAATIVAALVWHIWAFVSYGSFFIQAHVYDQVIKRVLYPIELHFGGKLFYVVEFIRQFNAGSIVIIGSGIYIIYRFLLKDARKIRSLTDVKFNTYRMLFLPYPFYILLLFSQSKISWYLLPLFPFFALSASVVFTTIKQKKFQIIFIAISILPLFITYFPGTYFYRRTKMPTDLIKVGQCVGELPIESGVPVAVLVNSQERQNREVVEAAHLQTETSFMYGGSPSFVFYAHTLLNIFTTQRYLLTNIIDLIS